MLILGTGKFSRVFYECIMLNSFSREEKDVTNKAKDVFNNIILENNEKFSNQDITKISGEATFFNRRKKKGITYELSSSVSWSGRFKLHFVLN